MSSEGRVGFLVSDGWGKKVLAVYKRGSGRSGGDFVVQIRMEKSGWREDSRGVETGRKGRRMRYPRLSGKEKHGTKNKGFSAAQKVPSESGPRIACSFLWKEKGT